jgi:uncharacterized tellurite resistance protein B-like protein
MTLLTILGSLLALVVLIILVSGLVVYVRFRQSPEKQWRSKVLGLTTAARRWARREDEELRRLGVQRTGEIRKLTEEAFQAHLASYSVSELEAYPGIGPATVAKLRDSGYANLAALQNAKLRIPGLGQKRLRDIGAAIRGLVQQARKTFDAVTAESARTLAGQLSALTAKYEALEVRARARAQAARQTSSRLQKKEVLAHQITFWRWLRPSAKDHLVSLDEITGPLPDLEAAVRAADSQAFQSLTVNGASGPLPGQPAPEALPSEPPVAVPASSRRQEVGKTKGRARTAAPLASPASVEDPHLVPLELTIQFAFSIARADGPLTEAEHEVIRQHLTQRFGSDRALLNRSKAFSAQYETAAIDLNQCVQQINLHFPPDDRAALLTLARQIVTASGPANPQVSANLNMLAQRLGVPPEAVPVSDGAASGPAPAPTRDECLALLEISSETPVSAALVRRQWNLLAPRYAADKVAALGPEFVALAQTKLTALRRAAEVLAASLGESLDEPAAPSPPQDVRHNPDLDEVFGGM